MPVVTRSPRPRVRLTLVLSALLAAAASPSWAASDAIRVLASDDRGVTLRLDLPAVSVVPGSAAGRSRLALAGLSRTDVPGRPLLPFASTLVALPPGARAVVSVT